MDEKDPINTTWGGGEAWTGASRLLFTPESPRGSETWTMGEVLCWTLLTQISVRLYGEYPSVKYPSWRMLGGYRIRKGGGGVRDVVIDVIHVHAIHVLFKDLNYKRPCVTVRHCKSHGQHQGLKVFPDQEWWAELCCHQPAIPRTASVPFPGPPLAIWLALFPSLQACHIFPLGAGWFVPREFLRHCMPS